MYLPKHPKLLMPTLRHENTIAQALQLYHRYQRNRAAYESANGANARLKWGQEFGEFCTRLNSYKTRIGLLQEARTCGSTGDLTAWLSQCPGPLPAVGTADTIEDAVRQLEQFLVHVGVIDASAGGGTTETGRAKFEPALSRQIDKMRTSHMVQEVGEATQQQIATDQCASMGSAPDKSNMGEGPNASTSMVGIYELFKTAQRLCASTKEFEVFLGFLQATVTPALATSNSSGDAPSAPTRTVPELMTYEEAANLLRMSVEALRGHVHRKNIPPEAIRQIGSRVLFHRPTLLGQVNTAPEDTPAEDPAGHATEKHSVDIQTQGAKRPARPRPSTHQPMPVQKRTDIDWSARVDAALADD
jgi:hypothetical protein